MLGRGAGQEPVSEFRVNVQRGHFFVRHGAPWKANLQAIIRDPSQYFSLLVELLLNLLLNLRPFRSILMNDEVSMDLQSFKRKVRPAGRGRVSRFAPYLEEIRQLRSGGYTLRQVCAWLATQRVKANVAALSVFLVRDARVGSKRKRAGRPRG
jgi:hypothetical protein